MIRSGAVVIYVIYGVAQSRPGGCLFQDVDSDNVCICFNRFIREIKTLSRQLGWCGVVGGMGCRRKFRGRGWLCSIKLFVSSISLCLRVFITNLLHDWLVMVVIFSKIFILSF